MKLKIFYFFLCGTLFLSSIVYGQETNKFNIYINDTETKNYNNFINSYNLINENMVLLIEDYKKKCGLKEDVVLTTHKMNYFLNDGNINAFYEILSDPFKNTETENSKLLMNLYIQLNDSVKTLCSSYENSRTYFNRAESAIISEDKIKSLHKDFLQSYYSFKESYYGFSKEFEKLNEKHKYSDIVFLSDMTLVVHSELNKSIVVVSELENIVSEISKYGYTFKSHEDYLINIKNLQKQIEVLSSYNENFLLDYGFSNNKIIYIDLFIFRLKKINLLLESEIPNYLLLRTNSSYNNSEVVFELANYSDELIIIYNDLGYIG